MQVRPGMAAEALGAGVNKVVCPYCKMEIPDGADICGHCRKNVSKLGMAGDGLKALGAIMFIMFALYFWFAS